MVIRGSVLPGFPGRNATRVLLFSQDLLHLADLLLYLAGCFLGFAFAFELAVPGDSSRDLLDAALHFVKLAFRFILRT